MCPRVEYAKRLGLPNLLNTEHNLLSLQERRKYLRLVFLFKVVEASVAAIPIGGYRLLNTTAAEGCSTCEN